MRIRENAEPTVATHTDEDKTYHRHRLGLCQPPSAAARAPPGLARGQNIPYPLTQLRSYNALRRIIQEGHKLLLIQPCTRTSWKPGQLFPRFWTKQTQKWSFVEQSKKFSLLQKAKRKNFSLLSKTKTIQFAFWSKTKFLVFSKNEQNSTKEDEFTPKSKKNIRKTKGVRLNDNILSFTHRLYRKKWLDSQMLPCALWV